MKVGESWLSACPGGQHLGKVACRLEELSGGLDGSVGEGTVGDEVIGVMGAGCVALCDWFYWGVRGLNGDIVSDVLEDQMVTLSLMCLSRHTQATILRMDCGG